jgi:outer membrane biosynthesis protein TonB
LNAAAPVALVLATLLLSGCEAPEAPVETEPAPTARETIKPGAAPAPEPEPEPEPDPEPKQDNVQAPVEQHSARPLKLTIDNNPRAGQRAATFGAAPRSDWLDTGPAAGGMDAAPAADQLLPDLFDTQTDSKAVSVEGKILTDGGSEGTFTTIEGAGVNIQLQTD